MFTHFHQHLRKGLMPLQLKQMKMKLKLIKVMLVLQQANLGRSYSKVTITFLNY
jgi:hypothetical protein